MVGSSGSGSASGAERSFPRRYILPYSARVGPSGVQRALTPLETARAEFSAVFTAPRPESGRGQSRHSAPHVQSSDVARALPLHASRAARAWVQLLLHSARAGCHATPAAPSDVRRTTIATLCFPSGECTRSVPLQWTGPMRMPESCHSVLAERSGRACALRCALAALSPHALPPLRVA
jgi:hypothetical protein